MHIELPNMYAISFFIFQIHFILADLIWDIKTGMIHWHLNLNLNGLLVTRQIDNTSPGGGGVRQEGN